MQIKFNGNKDDLSMIFLSAERYALGRQTYIVQWTCEVIANNLDLITLKDKKIMIRDIKLQADKGCDKPYGMECDKREWLQLLDILTKNCEKEEKKYYESKTKNNKYFSIKNKRRTR